LLLHSVLNRAAISGPKHSTVIKQRTFR